MVRAIEILKDEFEMNMRLIGATNLSELTPEMIDASQLSQRGGHPSDYLFHQNYERLAGVGHGLGGRARL